MNRPTLPNFFIAGAPKAGTTSLYQYLDQHPEIYMSRIKEPHYFATEIRPERFSRRLQVRAERDAQDLRDYLAGPMDEKRFFGLVTQWSDYLKLFQQASGRKAIGEASVCYLWSESAPGNIRAAIPDARIILVLRNPVEMVFSMYLQSRGSGAIECTLREAIEMGLAQRAGVIDIFHPFLELGLYHAQVRRMLETFSEQRLRVFVYEEFRAEPMRILAEIFRFLGVDPEFRPDRSKRYLESKMPGVLLESEERKFLTDFYREDIGKLGNLLGRDLSAWLLATNNAAVP